MRIKLLYFIYLLSLFYTGKSQNKAADSLLSLIKQTTIKLSNQASEEKLALLNLQLGEAVYLNLPDSARIYWERSAKICEKLLQSSKGNDTKNIKSIYANPCNNIGYIAKMLNKKVISFN